MPGTSLPSGDASGAAGDRGPEKLPRLPSARCARTRTASDAQRRGFGRSSRCLRPLMSARRLFSSKPSRAPSGRSKRRTCGPRFAQRDHVRVLLLHSGMNRQKRRRAATAALLLDSLGCVGVYAMRSRTWLRDLRRRNAAPTAPNPSSIMAQVDGSGTAPCGSGVSAT